MLCFRASGLEAARPVRNRPVAVPRGDTVVAPFELGPTRLDHAHGRPLLALRAVQTVAGVRRAR